MSCTAGAAARAGSGSCHQHDHCQCSWAQNKSKGWGGGVSNSPSQQAECFPLEPSTTYQAVEQPSSVKSTCKQVLPNTALACTPFLSLDELHSWGSCQSWLWQLPPAPPLPNESAAFQAGLHTHQKTPNPRGELH